MDNLSGQPVPETDLPDTSMSGQPVPQEDMPDSLSGQPVPISDLPEEDLQGKYGTTGQQTIAGLEGAAQGAIGPLAPLIETKVLGIPAEDIASRAEANPVTSHGSEAAGMAASMYFGVGELGLLAKALPEFKMLGKIGSAALRGGLEMAAVQGGDEVSKYILNTQPPDESAANVLANVAFAGIMGSATGGLFGLGEWAGSTGMKALENNNIAKRAQSWLAGYGDAELGKTMPKYDPFIKKYVGKEAGLEIDKAAYNAGQKMHQEMPEWIAKQAIDKTVEGIGLAHGVKDFFAAKYIETQVEKILKKPLSTAAKKFIVPYLNKALTSDMAKAAPANVEYALKSFQGAKKIQAAIDGLFKGTGQGIVNYSIDQMKKDRVNQAIEDNILDRQMDNQKAMENQLPGFAEGGKVHGQEENHFANAMPNENAMLQTAKARVYNHLKSMKPRQQQSNLLYNHSEPTEESKRVYDKALDLAVNPLSIMKHVKNGTISSSDVIHMNQMWPELNEHLKKKITERIIVGQLRKEKPNYKTRQGLAVLLGTALETAMTPQGILAAQSSFQNNRPPPQNQSPQKKKAANLGAKTNQLYKTPNEAAEADQAVRK